MALVLPLEMVVVPGSDGPGTSIVKLWNPLLIVSETLKLVSCRCAEAPAGREEKIAGADRQRATSCARHVVAARSAKQREPADERADAQGRRDDDPVVASASSVPLPDLTLIMQERIDLQEFSALTG